MIEQPPEPPLITDADALGRLIFETLRAANALLAAGDDLMKPLGLSSARWQVLATVGHLDRPETVSGIARRLSLSRQAVQRVSDELCRDGLLGTADNPAHARARLLRLTDAGIARLAEAEALRKGWTLRLAQKMRGLDAQAANRGLLALRKALQDGDQAGA